MINFISDVYNFYNKIKNDNSIPVEIRSDVSDLLKKAFFKLLRYSLENNDNYDDI